MLDMHVLILEIPQPFKVYENTFTLLTPSFGNHLFANYLVLKHPLTNLILSSVILLHSKSPKKCHKNFEIQFINKNLRPKNDLDLVFYMYKGGNPKFLNLEFSKFGDSVPAFGPHFSISLYLALIYSI